MKTIILSLPQRRTLKVRKFLPTCLVTQRPHHQRIAYNRAAAKREVSCER